MAVACKRLVEAGLIRFAGTRADGKPGRTKLDYEVKIPDGAKNWPCIPDSLPSDAMTFIVKKFLGEDLVF